MGTLPNLAAHATKKDNTNITYKTINMFTFTLYSDSPVNYSFGFQDPASQWMLGIIGLHDFIIFYLIILLVVVLWGLISVIKNDEYLGLIAHGNLIELIWTIAPTLILWKIGIPSLKLLYLMDEILDSEVTVKAIGNQWYAFNAINKSKV